MGLSAYVDHVVARAREAPVDLSRFGPYAVPGTIFSGATGVALFLVEVVRLRGHDEALLRLARAWLDAVNEWVPRAKDADWRYMPRGFIHGEAGIAYVDALVSAGLGNDSLARAAVERFERVTQRFDDVGAGVRRTGIVGGEAGVVHAAGDLAARLPEGAGYEHARALLRRVHDRALASLLSVHSSPLDADPQTILGMAHGVAGELFVLVTSVGPDHPDVRARLAELALLRQVDPHGHVFWLPRRESDDISLVDGWCNGMAGYTLLWSEVARRKRSKKALRLAEESARSAAFLMSANPGICCGLAGQSIALQRFADVSGDARYARRAYDRLTRAAALAERDESYALGFWQGALGVAFAALARSRGERAFPCLESGLPATTSPAAPASPGRTRAR